MSEDESDPYDPDSEPDPVAFTTATPEPSINETDKDGGDVDVPVYAISIGPGDLEYLIPRGRQAIRKADVIIDFKTAADFVADETDADLLTYSYTDEVGALTEFGRHVTAGDRGTAVLMGDSNCSDYRFFGKVQQTVGQPARAIPGTSPFQTVTSRTWTSMEDTRFVTFHKSGSLSADLDRLAEAAGERHPLVLPRLLGWVSDDIAEFFPNSDTDALLDTLVFERLTHNDKRITRIILDDLHDSTGGNGPDSTPYSDLSVLAIGTSVNVAD